MPDVLDITTPIFLLIGLGFAAVRFGLYARTALPPLGRFVITFCIPALLFQAISQRHLAEVANVGYLLAYAGGSLLALACGWLWARAQHQPRDAAAMTAMGMACANTAFIGYPIALQVVGPEATVALAMTFLVENFLMIPLCLALADSAGASHQPLAPAFGRALLGLRRNPVVLGILAGLVATLLGWQLPAPVQRAVDLLAMAASASALFFIGGSLVGLQVRGLVAQVSAVAVGKLLIHPLAVMGAVLLVGQTMGPLAPQLQWAAVLLAAAPMLGIYAIVGQAHGRQAIHAASMLVATVASFATLAAVVGLLHWMWGAPPAH